MALNCLRQLARWAAFVDLGASLLTELCPQVLSLSANGLFQVAGPVYEGNFQVQRGVWESWQLLVGLSWLLYAKSWPAGPAHRELIDLLISFHHRKWWASLLTYIVRCCISGGRCLSVDWNRRYVAVKVVRNGSIDNIKKSYPRTWPNFKISLVLKFTAPSWCVSGGEPVPVGRLFGGMQIIDSKCIDIGLSVRGTCFYYLCNTRYPLSAICHRHQIAAQSLMIIVIHPKCVRKFKFKSSRDARFLY